MKDHSSGRSSRISRRLFTAAVAGSPVLFAQERQPGNPLTVQNLGPQYGKRPPIAESAPFAESLTFTRDEIACPANPFPMSQVRLLAGPFRQAADANRAYMERLPVDRLLHNFRLNAGLPSSSTPLGGWESPKSELRGHFTGHYLSACALDFASTGGPDAKARGDEMVAELARVQNQLGRGGYLSAFPIELFDRLDQRKGVWAPFYTVHKIMAGLLDMRIHAGNHQALDVVSKMANWVNELERIQVRDPHAGNSENRIRGNERGFV